MVRAGCQTFVKGENNQGAIGVEVLVREQRGQKVTRPSSSSGERAIVAIVGCKSNSKLVKFKEIDEGMERDTHVGGNEHPLGQFVVVQVFVEHSKVLRFSKAVGIRCNRVIAHQGTWK